MNIEKLREAKFEAERFLKKADDLLSEDGIDQKTYSVFNQQKKSGAIKRSSMDLTRALSELRKPY